MRKIIYRKEKNTQHALIVILFMLINFPGCAREIVGNDRLGPPWNEHAQTIEGEAFQETITTYQSCTPGRAGGLKAGNRSKRFEYLSRLKAAA
jgi:hypothetical protein